MLQTPAHGALDTGLLNLNPRAMQVGVGSGGCGTNSWDQCRSLELSRARLLGHLLPWVPMPGEAG